jgi:hypothetical protein
MGAAVAAVRHSSFGLPFVLDGEVHRDWLDESWDVRFELVMPARSFPSFKKQRNSRVCGGRPRWTVTSSTSRGWNATWR